VEAVSKRRPEPVEGGAAHARNRRQPAPPSTGSGRRLDTRSTLFRATRDAHPELDEGLILMSLNGYSGSSREGGEDRLDKYP